ncbi:C6 zinc finger domain containing protein [Lasiodiplodia theobromae]|uniref:C6 zinc finger domain containing protein n=1 Tax=Lasiodiplodia theobromae TaxID=45133 RepID=UPI0015C3479B|nr:C6 zinc finger domain containing protein [Lasiodiplodia theobromae]KAF4541032.1 C6 zinc finger domain containing protein [Lasiodiplodia theobromae]
MCDLQRPACGQCLKSGLECGGYDRQRIFINHTSTAQSCALTTVAPPTRRIPVESSERAAKPLEIVLPDALTRTAYELKSLGMFWEAYLPQGVPFTSANAQFTTGSWLGIIDSIFHREDCLKHALLAMSLATVGRQRGDPWMVNQGYASHGKSLREMAYALQSPERVKKDELVAASKLMGLFEILFGADDRDDAAQARSWSSHIKGELVLIQARGPHAHMHGQAHQLFVDGRFSMMIQAARSRKKSVFSEPQWKEIPWQVIPKTPKDALLDIMVDLPTLMEKLDNFVEGEHEEGVTKVLREALMQECWDADRRLLEWVRTMKFFVDVDKVAHVEQVGNFAVAQLIYFYWAACIMLFSILQSANMTSAQPDALPPRTDPRVYARKIAHSASYFFEPDAGLFGAHVASFSIGMALTVLRRTGTSPQDKEDHELLTRVLDIPGVNATIGKFLYSMRARYDVNQCHLRGPVS